MRTIEKASGRQAGSVVSGIRERKGEGGRALLTSHFSLPEPARRPPLFPSSPLTESLEQAKFVQICSNLFKLSQCQICSEHFEKFRAIDTNPAGGGHSFYGSNRKKRFPKWRTIDFENDHGVWTLFVTLEGQNLLSRAFYLKSKLFQ